MGTDGKYGRVVTEHGDIPDDEPVIVFRACDRHVPSVLDYYRELCRAGGSPQRHLDLVSRAKTVFEDWQREHRDQVRTPASEGSREWMTE